MDHAVPLHLGQLLDRPGDTPPHSLTFGVLLLHHIDHPEFGYLASLPPVLLDQQCRRSPELAYLPAKYLNKIIRSGLWRMLNAPALLIRLGSNSHRKTRTKPVSLVTYWSLGSTRGLAVSS